MSRGVRAIRAWGAFTLIELLVVISIFVLLLAIGVPAFSSMLYSSEQSMAENAVRIGLGSARDTALRAGPGRDAAAVFLYEHGRIAIIPCVRVGAIDDEDPANPTLTVSREIFAPVAGVEPIRLPRGWMVRGYAAPGMIDTRQWYERTYAGAIAQGNWVFPETSFYDEDAGDEGDERQTFMVRFEGGSGVMKNDPAGVLVLFPSQSTRFRSGMPWGSFRADEEMDGERFVRRVLSAPPSTLSQRNMWRVLGNEASDTILTKGVGLLAVYNEKKLSAGLGGAVRTDPVTGCLYQNLTAPTFVPSVNINALNAWIEGGTYSGGTWTREATSECRIFAVQRYLGTLQEVTGSVNGEGVSQ